MIIRVVVETIRIQRKRTKGSKMPPNTIYVGRPSKWGNPYKVGYFQENGDHQYVTTNEQAVSLYTEYLFRSGLVDHIEELRGKNLACFCELDEPCHADILLRVARIEP
jgi:hypothetical protein